MGWQAPALVACTDRTPCPPFDGAPGVTVWPLRVVRPEGWGQSQLLSKRRVLVASAKRSGAQRGARCDNRVAGTVRYMVSHTRSRLQLEGWWRILGAAAATSVAVWCARRIGSMEPVTYSLECGCWPSLRVTSTNSSSSSTHVGASFRDGPAVWVKVFLDSAHDCK